MSRLPIKSLSKVYDGHPIMVLGGGPSMPSDYARAKRAMGQGVNPVLIAINDHAFYFIPAIKIDFMVFCDNPRKFPETKIDYYQQEVTGRRVSILPEFSDWHFDGVKKWYDGNSATLAIWLACFLGGSPVVLCGFDLYQGDEVYFHGDRTNDKETAKHIENHLRPFDNCIMACPGAENIRAVSGPLVNLFGRYATD